MRSRCATSGVNKGNLVFSPGNRDSRGGAKGKMAVLVPLSSLEGLQGGPREVFTHLP